METEQTINIGKIKAVANLYSGLSELQSQWNELTKPPLTDLSLLTLLYNLYLSLFERRGISEKATKPYHRRKFLLVILYLYSPRTLAGGKMVGGLRDKLAELFGLSGKSAISDNIPALVFHYENYRDFRKDVDMIYDEIRQALNALQYSPLS